MTIVIAGLIGESILLLCLDDSEKSARLSGISATGMKVLEGEQGENDCSNIYKVGSPCVRIRPLTNSIHRTLKVLLGYE